MRKDSYKAFSSVKLPNILGLEDSFNVLKNNSKSICRLGDGEFGCLFGGIPFQEYSETLSISLKKILRENNDMCLVCLAKPHFYKMDDVYPHVIEFAEKWSKKAIERGYLDLINMRRTYLDTSITIPYHHYLRDDLFWESYFDKIGRLILGKDLILVTGDEHLTKDKTPFFSLYARSIDVVKVSGRHCWNERFEVIPRIRKISIGKDVIVVFCCGPAGTVWAWELSGEMMCYDFGHLAREYEFWTSKKNPSERQREFFTT